MSTKWILWGKSIFIVLIYNNNYNNALFLCRDKTVIRQSESSAFFIGLLTFGGLPHHFDGGTQCSKALLIGFMFNLVNQMDQNIIAGNFFVEIDQLNDRAADHQADVA